MPDVTKKMPYVISGVAVPGTLSVNTVSGEASWTAISSDTPSFVSKSNTNYHWREYSLGQSVKNLVTTIPNIGQPPSEASKYRTTRGDRLSIKPIEDLEDTILNDLATNG